MPFSHQFKPAHKEIKRYHEELTGYAEHEVANEGATSSAFQNLLAATCKKKPTGTSSRNSPPASAANKSVTSLPARRRLRGQLQSMAEKADRAAAFVRLQLLALKEMS